MTWNGMEGNKRLTLIVKSTPDYGLKTATPPAINANTGRLGPTFGIAIETVQPVQAGQIFEWIVTGQGIVAAQCFSAVAGTLSPTVGLNRFTVPLEVTETTACYGKNFTVVVGPRGVITNPLFSRTASFTLIAPAQLRDPGKLTDDRLKIQGQPPIIRQ